MNEVNRLSKKGIINVGRWIDVLPNIEECTQSRLARRYNITYSYLISMTSEFERRGWVTIHKDGKFKIIKLTPLGKEIVKVCYLFGECIK